MSSIQTKIKDEVIIAMKAKDKDLVQVLKNVKVKLDNEAKLQKVESISDKDAEKIIQKYVKERKESLAIAETAGRDDLVSKEQYEIDVFSEYLPKILTEDETRNIITSLVEGGADNIGAIMGQLGKYGNTIDKGLASKIARELI